MDLKNMNTNKIIKTSYHLFASLFLLFLVYSLDEYNVIIRILLLLIAIFHIYDTWWFLHNEGNAPI
jgi:TRAP-type mannitol/chloroaromatic compound transport system permease small subunit